MLFNYKVLTTDGTEKKGSIDSLNKDTAIRTLQQRGFTIVSIESDEKSGIFSQKITFFERVPLKDIVIMSRQISTLFTAHISALRIFRMLSEQTENALFRRKLIEVADDIQGGSAISDAMNKHPKIFSNFYVNMVRSGEESGKLSEIFESLADYLDRSYELTVKIRNAFIYPAFVISTFIVVMILMLTLVFPNLAIILVESGQEIPIYTKIIMGFSNFLIDYGFFFLILLVVGGVWWFRYIQTPSGKRVAAVIKLNIPIIGKLFKKTYLSRISDNMYTLLNSGISIVRTIEITASVVDNVIYEDILLQSNEEVKGGVPLSEALSKYEEIPVIMVQIIKVGEETGELGTILKTLSTFYKREVDNMVDTLIDLIEPILIVALGLGVGLVLTSVLVPIYNVSTGI